MSDDFKTNVLSPKHWLRILIMIFFAVVTWVLGIIFTVLVVAQALFSLVTGRDNPNLRQLGGALSLYFYQVLRFLVYRSEFRPFPFAPFPIDDEAEGDPLAARGQPGHAPARQAPVARPDFASEHEPEAATAAGVAAATAASTVGAATTAPPPGASAQAPATVAQPDFASEHEPEAALGTADSAAHTAVAEDVAVLPAEQPCGTGTAANSLTDDTALTSTPADPAIVITETRPVPDATGDSQSPSPPSSEAGPGAAGATPSAAPADDQHKQW